MKKEEILEASKKENKNKDIFVMEVESKGTTWAAAFMLLLATVYFIFEMFNGKGINPALYSIISIYNTVLYGYKAIKIEEKTGLNTFASLIWGILTLMLILEYFKVK